MAMTKAQLREKRGIGPEYQEIRHNHSTAVAYIKQMGPGVLVRLFSGRKVKPQILAFNLDQQERMQAAITRHFNRVKEHENEKAKYKRAYSHEGIEIGDIFSHSWGYDQTNVDFYQVVGKTGKATLIVRPICSSRVEATGPMAEMVTALKDQFKGSEFKVRTDGKYFKTNVGYASKWDGKPMYSSWYH